MTTIFMRRKNVGYDYTTFIDPEDSDAIIEYLRKVKRVTKDSAFDSQFDNYPLFTPYGGRTTKIDGNTFIQIFKNISIKMRVHAAVKKEEPFKYNPCRSHNLRKFFRTALLHDGLDDFLINHMMGHVVDRTLIAYYINNTEKLKELYMQHMHALAINSNGSEIDLFKEKQKLKAELSLAKSQEDSPENAFMDMLQNDKELQAMLFKKYKEYAAQST